MRKFFTDSINLDKSYIISDDKNRADAKHIIKSLRMNIGDRLILSSPDGYDYTCEIKSLDMGNVFLDVIGKQKNDTEPKTHIHLFQCMTKGSKFEFIIQKAVELGVSEITPVISEFTISRPKDDSQNKKIKRAQKIMEEAAKQSNRGIIPKINDFIAFKKSFDVSKKSSDILIFYENATSSIKSMNLKKGAAYSIYIGSEGGFSEDEINFAKQMYNAKILSLGKRILRTETASIAALSALYFALDEF